MNDIQALQEEQSRILSAIHAVSRLRGEDDPDIEDLVRDYDATVTQLVDQLGPDVPCAQVDPFAWRQYEAATAVSRFLSFTEVKDFFKNLH